jgi:hypothetical protein
MQSWPIQQLNDFSDRQKTVLKLGAFVQICLLLAALIDVRRWPAEQIRGKALEGGSLRQFCRTDIVFRVRTQKEYLAVTRRVVRVQQPESENSPPSVLRSFRQAAYLTPTNGR